MGLRLNTFWRQAPLAFSSLSTSRVTDRYCTTFLRFWRGCSTRCATFIDSTSQTWNFDFVDKVVSSTYWVRVGLAPLNDDYVRLRCLFKGVCSSESCFFKVSRNRFVYDRRILAMRCLPKMTMFSSVPTRFGIRRHIIMIRFLGRECEYQS